MPYIRSDKSSEVSRFKLLMVRQRVDGFQKALAEYPEIKVVVVVETILPKEAVEPPIPPSTIIAAYPNLAGIFSATGASAAQVGSALKEAEKCGKVQVYSWGIVQDGINLMREGCLQVFASERPYALVAQTVDALIAMIQNGTELPEVTDLGIILVNIGNLDSFLASNN